MNTSFAASALAAAIGLTAAAGSGSAAAASPEGMEKCYGVAEAGKNDCAAPAAGHSCAGQAVKDNDPLSFIYVPAGLCDRLAGGSVEPGEA